MKKNIVVFCLLFVSLLQSQNKPVLYGFDDIPQGLLLNPAKETTYKTHIGIPLLSGLHADVNIRKFTAADLFGTDGTGVIAGTDFDTKLNNILNGLGNKDYASINMQVDVINVGKKINSRDYLNGGFYTELDAFVGFPKDLLLLVKNGNYPYVEESFPLSDIAFKGDFLGVWHIGISRRYNNRLTIGGRAKIYTAAANISSTRNYGTVITEEGTDAIYEVDLNNLDAAVHTAGFVDENEEGIRPSIGNLFFSPNIGLGVDLGFTFHLNEQMEISGSLLDLGFIRYSKNTSTIYLDGDYSFSGYDYIYSSDVNPNVISDEFEESIELRDDDKAYVVSRPVKLNSSFRYSFGKTRYNSTCHDIRMKDYFDNAVGAQIYSIFRPYGMRFALTGFYERRFAKFLNTKITYTVDDFSATNFGLGISANIWKLKVYGGFNNIFKMGDLTKANTATAQLGINLLFN